MQNKVTQFTLAALLVMIIGGFGGYYFFIKKETEETASESAARGENTSFGGSLGSTYENISGQAVQNAGTSTATVGQRAPRLWHVTRTPVAGFGFSAGGSAVFIAERATGNILRADPSVSTINRLTNTLVPKVRDALFSRTGDVVLRSTNDDGMITSFAATIATTTVLTSSSTPSVLEGTYLPQNIVALDAPNHQPTSRGLFFMTLLPEGGSVGVTSNWKGGAVKKVFTSPLSQWRAQALADGRTVLTQNPSDDIAGYSFMVSAAGAVRALITDEPGLTLAHHDSSDAYLFGTSEQGTLSLYLKVGNQAAVQLPIGTTADKCVWAPGAGLIAYCAVPTVAPTGQYLLSWHQGVSHTIDVWWKIEANEKTATRFFVPDSRANFDVEDAAMDETGSYLGWRDAADKSLWLLRISE